jgi:hypothetical protein
MFKYAWRLVVYSLVALTFVTLICIDDWQSPDDVHGGQKIHYAKHRR